MKDKVVIITGAAGGLGRTFALAFAKEGATIVVSDINEKAARETVELIEKAGSTAIAIKTDVSDESSTRQLAKQTVDTFGKIDVLINNAAIYAGVERKPFYEISEQEWDLVMNVNLKGTWLCSKAVVPFMKETGGKIVHISSATVMSGSPNWAHYVASKGGVIGLTRSMAREVGDFNINVNAVAPGFTLTDASLGLMTDAASYGVNRGAIKRASKAEDIVGAVLFLSSENADFISGQTLIVDGGKQFI